MPSEVFPSIETDTIMANAQDGGRLIYGSLLLRDWEKDKELLNRITTVGQKELKKNMDREVDADQERERIFELSKAELNNILKQKNFPIQAEHELLTLDREAEDEKYARGILYGFNMSNGEFYTEAETERTDWNLVRATWSLLQAYHEKTKNLNITTVRAMNVPDQRMAIYFEHVLVQGKDKRIMKESDAYSS